MKFSIISTILLGAISVAMADLEYFVLPHSGSVFGTTDKISFKVDGISDDGDDSVLAQLYTADGQFVQVIGEWPADKGEDSLFDDDDDFVFTWDVSVGAGDYFVRVFEMDSGHQEDDDDIHRSYTFTIGGDSYAAGDKQIATESRKKRSIYTA